MDPTDNCNCGPNAICNNGICSCLPDFHGDPYAGCRPECVMNTDCPFNKACSNNKCIDPCSETCGYSAVCNVYNHIPMCTCPERTTGDAFIACNPYGMAEIIRLSSIDFKQILYFISSSTEPSHNPCNPSPCGPNSICREINQQAVCSCVSGYLGSPPSCRPECIQDLECPHNRACSNKKCIDPCTGACGIRAECRVINHKPICTCLHGYTGSPHVLCHLSKKFFNLKNLLKTFFNCT